MTIIVCFVLCRDSFLWIGHFLFMETTLELLRLPPPSHTQKTNKKKEAKKQKKKESIWNGEQPYIIDLILNCLSFDVTITLCFVLCYDIFSAFVTFFSSQIHDLYWYLLGGHACFWTGKSKRFLHWKLTMEMTKSIYSAAASEGSVIPGQNEASSPPGAVIEIRESLSKFHQKFQIMVPNQIIYKDLANWIFGNSNSIPNSSGTLRGL